MNKKDIFQAGLFICCFLYVAFSLIYEGQMFMDLLYYTLMPISFLFMCYGYPHQNNFTRSMKNVLIVVVVYNIAKMLGIVDYDFEGLKLYAPVTFIISNIYYYH